MTLNIVQEIQKQNENHVQSEEGKKEEIATYDYPSTERRRSIRLLQLSEDKAKLIEKNGYSGLKDGSNGGETAGRNVSLRTILKVKLKEKAPSRDRDKLQKGEKGNAQAGTYIKKGNGVKQNRLVKKVTLNGNQGKTMLGDNHRNASKVNKKKIEKGVVVVMNKKKNASLNKGNTNSKGTGLKGNANKGRAQKSKGNSLMVCKMRIGSNLQGKEKEKMQAGKVPKRKGKKEASPVKDDLPDEKIKSGSDSDYKEEIFLQKRLKMSKATYSNGAKDASKRSHPNESSKKKKKKMATIKNKQIRKSINEFMKNSTRNNSNFVPNSKYNIYSYGKGKNVFYSLERINYSSGDNPCGEENKRKLNRIPEIINIKKQKFVIGSSNRKCDLVLRGNIEGEQCELVCKCVEKNINHCSDINRQINKYNLFIINKSKSKSTLLNNSVVDIDQVKDEDSLFLGIENMDKRTNAKYIYKIKYNKMANIFNINNLCMYSKDNCIQKTLITNAENGKASKIVSTNFSLINQSEEQESNISILIFLIIEMPSIENEPVHYIDNLNSFANLNSTPRKISVEDNTVVSKASTSVNKMIKEDSPNTQFNESIKKINKICQSRISPLCIKDSIKKEEKVKGTLKSTNHTKELPVTLLNACVELCKEISRSVTKEHDEGSNHTVPAGTPVTKYPSLTPPKGVTPPKNMTPPKDMVTPRTMTPPKVSSSHFFQSDQKKRPYMNNLCNLFRSSFVTPGHERSSTGETTNRIAHSNSVVAMVREKVSTSGDRLSGMQYQGSPINGASKSLNKASICEKAHLQGNSQHHISHESKYNLHKSEGENFLQGNTNREEPSKEEKISQTDYTNLKCNADDHVSCPPPIDQHTRVYCEDVEMMQNVQIGERVHEEELNTSLNDSLLITPGKGAQLMDSNQMTFYDCKDEKVVKEADPLPAKPNESTKMVMKASESSEFIKKTEKELYSVLYSKSSESTTSSANTDFILCLKNEQGEERYLKVIGEIKVKRNAILSDIKHNIDLKLLDKSIELTTLNKLNYLKCESLSKGKYSIRLNAFSDKLDETKFGEFSALHLDYIDNVNFSHLDTLEPLELKKMLFIKYDE
ncbi:conserved Plasmodium protein, unknown function [Plasmodium knowlesi strain H]|uniref:Uncharacterized protein n=3 Tax=Plasmodium knowlesi TaxID=5850 RepID=A0A5K1V581_PLAKH|nr:conserved Plasmodium protein, unknown function [Plasmodium knowlesi strain H]OTN67711.1 Uncharacterized protein PKNOH_S05382900 [Plasmodium knowlesi]CAA9990420.1 conserved Plasmodium protein, unknown function [Plasmodium knowlesi strain H]SBO19626.1 conserved Plasmodium protein, unknown function [Plasmodium knowlesi strain H]SBO22580.1 conserved Plasmodium protein, unknown function [Plasmodium knowlesi strain H]VVS79894.1 conserved Plasmodium protein, unknown function [Plasmodium knowlesi s|eukprot:XP_002260820.1 hypothetical protein, conserved in Plasmodium species [Plasmodium knowlesi strain H]